jgi:Zinc finger, C2H2 type
MESAGEALPSSKALEGQPWEQREFDMLRAYCVPPPTGHQNPQQPAPIINNIQSMATPNMPMPSSTYNFIHPQNNTFEAPFLQYLSIYNMEEAAPAYCMQQNMPSQKGFFPPAFTQYGDPDTIMTDAPISDPFFETQEVQDFFNFNTLPPQTSAAAPPLVFNQPYLPVYDLEIQLDIPALNLPTPPQPQQPPPKPQPQPEAQGLPQSANDRKRKRQSHQTAQVARQPKPVQQCQDCSYSNSNMQEFNRHVNSVHQGIRNHPCGVCGTPYNDASSLAKHKKSAKHKKRMRDLGIPLPDEVMFECPECRAHGRQRRFGRPDQLQRHLQKCKHTNGVLPAGFRSGVGGMDRGRVRL